MATFDESRPGLAGFNAFYARRIQPKLAELETERRAKVKWMLASAAGLAVSLAGTLWLFLTDGPWFFAPAVVAIGFFIAGAKAYADIRGDFKTVLVAPVCEFFELAYTAKPADYPLGWFRELSLLPGYDRSSLEDRIAGRRQEVPLELIEAKLEERRTRSTKNGTETYYATVFRGLLGQFTFPKPFQGRTVVKTDRGAVFNWFEGKATPGERVRLEDPRFEAAFQVYSDDQVEARYLLTPTFMERLLALDQHFGGRVTRVAFDAERLLLAVEHDRDLFEGGSLFAPADDPEHVESILRELALVLAIVEILQLQLKTRI